EHHPDIQVAEVGPQQGADGDGGEDQRAAHGGGALLRQVRLGAVIAHRLADLAQLQGADHPGSEKQCHAQGGQHPEDAPQGQVLEHTETGVKLLQVLRKYQQHVGLPSSLFCEPSTSAATTSSMPALREPFTSTRTLGSSSVFSAAASALRLSKLRPSAPNASAASADRGPVAYRASRPRSRAYSPISRCACCSLSPSSPMSPSTSTRRPVRAASTSMAARTEAGLAL